MNDIVYAGSLAFDAESMPGVLDGTKTETRRLLKPQPRFRPARSVVDCAYWIVPLAGARDSTFFAEESEIRVKPWLFWHLYWAGDVCWVQEPHYRWVNANNGLVEFHYLDDLDVPSWAKLTPARYMRREWSRAAVRIVKVWAEPVQEIQQANVLREGCPAVYRDGTYAQMQWWIERWDGLSSKGYAWASNPWVVAYRFEVVKP